MYRLVPESRLHEVGSEAKKRIADVLDQYSVDVDNPDYGRPFLYYLVFTHCPRLVYEDISLSDVFYNRFYWYIRFATDYAVVHGTATGLEQQYYDLLDEAEGMDNVDLEKLFELRAEISDEGLF